MRAEGRGFLCLWWPAGLLLFIMTETLYMMARSVTVKNDMPVVMHRSCRVASKRIILEINLNPFKVKKNHVLEIFLTSTPTVYARKTNHKFCRYKI